MQNVGSASNKRRNGLRAAVTCCALVPISVAFGVLGASSAAANPGSGLVLAWEDSNLEGDLYVEASPYDCANFGTGCFVDIDGWDGDNELSSIWNQSSCDAKFWTNDDPSGLSYTVRAGQRVNDVAAIGLDNDFESFEWICN